MSGVANQVVADLSLVLLPGENEHYLAVYVQLLGAGRLPMYQAIAGAITDMDVVRSKIVRIAKTA